MIYPQWTKQITVYPSWLASVAIVVAVSAACKYQIEMMKRIR